MAEIRLYIILLLACGVSFSVYSQNDSLQTLVEIPESPQLNSRKDYLNFITENYGWIFSYNASVLDVTSRSKIQPVKTTISSVVEQIFYPDKVQLTYVAPNKIVLQNLKSPKRSGYLLSGIVRDADTGEAIYGAFVVEKDANVSAITNEKGYFVMKLDKRNVRIETYYLGYIGGTYSETLDKNTFIKIDMISHNFLDTIHIHNPTARLQLTDGGNLVEVFKMKGFQSIIGEPDIINNARVLPGVVSGGEGLSGLFVRGGTPDQNLTMIDGVALYESSHLVGITSIFMDEAINEASFIKNGFPARYGGRLSSVLDIQLKEGDKNKNNTVISAGLAGLKVHLDGPIIKDKFTYSISSRVSWLNFYINNLLRKYTKYDDIYLKYHDLLGKFTYHFTPNNSISLSFYNGSDRFFLTKSNTLKNERDDYTLMVYDKNGISWSNNVGSLKWNYLIGDKLNIKAQTGFINYSNNARSTYIFNNIVGDSSKVDQLDVLTQTNILDYNLRLDGDYYLDDQNVLRAGFNILKQVYNPTLKQSTIILKDDAEKIIDRDSSIHTNHLQFYIEDNFKWRDKIFLYGGLHLGVFKINKKNYTSLQPRLKAIWSISDMHMVSVSYSRMTQFVHLLSNSGLGLPSSLWVPSTELIKPQYSDQWSTNYTFNINRGMYVQIGAYTRTFSNVLEYTTPIDMFYFLINGQSISTIYNTSRDWERNVYAGTGTSKGLELLVHKNVGRFTGWSSATYSRTLRSFNSINHGKPFPATQDKPWDVNLGFNYSFSERWNAGANFVYNTGNAFSLSTEEYDSYLGIKLLNSDGKNNYRLPDFHQLSINVMYSHPGESFDTQIALKLYNVYNRLNAYYIYIYKSDLAPDVILPRKVSILPFTPSISVSAIF